jgi:hypothetical protein
MPNPTKPSGFRSQIISTQSLLSGN